MAAKDQRASRAARERARIQRETSQRVHRDWCQRHPQRAAEERALRQDLRDQDAKFGRVAYGTPETRAKASKVRQGALARLHRTGAISIQQLGAALEIAAAYQKIIASAGVSTSWSMADRVDISFNPEAFELIGGVWAEYAYSRWRTALPRPGPVLAMIVEDCGIEAAARRFSMDRRTAGKLLRSALDLWSTMYAEARDYVTDERLAAAHESLR